MYLRLETLRRVLHAPTLSGQLRSRSEGCGSLRGLLPLVALALMADDMLAGGTHRHSVADVLPLTIVFPLAIRRDEMANQATAKTVGRNFFPNIYSGPLFRPLCRGGRVQDRGITVQAVCDVVAGYAAELGMSVRPHDLRRTFAILAHKGGTPIDQIQLSLGHSSLQTTERYLGVDQDLTSAPCDALGLRL